MTPVALAAAATFERPRSGRNLRPCRREDLPAVAALYEAVYRSGCPNPPPRLARYFERTFFDCPWADSELPPLVYEDEAGAIVGFVGSHVRRMRLDGRRIRVACGGQLVVDERARARAVGAMLFRARLRGPQDASIADGANAQVRAMWAACGGETAPLKTIAWTRVLQPIAHAADYVLGRLGRPGLNRPLGRLWAPLDRLAGRRWRPRAPRSRTELLTPELAMAHLPELTRGLRCYPDYDERYLDWLFGEMAQLPSRGELVRLLVRDREGRALGWYLYHFDRRFAHVLQLAARAGAAGEVLDDLFHHAWAKGALAVRGRLEPHLAEALSTRRCLYGWSGTSLIHARSSELLGVLLSSRCWLDRADGESWMGHHTEAFA